MSMIIEMLVYMQDCNLNMSPERENHMRRGLYAIGSDMFINLSIIVYISYRNVGAPLEIILILIKSVNKI